MVGMTIPDARPPTRRLAVLVLAASVPVLLAAGCGARTGVLTGRADACIGGSRSRSHGTHGHRLRRGFGWQHLADHRGGRPVPFHAGTGELYPQGGWRHPGEHQSTGGQDRGGKRRRHLQVAEHRSSAACLDRPHVQRRLQRCDGSAGNRASIAALAGSLALSSHPWYNSYAATQSGVAEQERRCSDLRFGEVLGCQQRFLAGKAQCS